MKLPSKFKHLRFQLADVDTQDVSQFFDASYQFIEEGRGASEGRAFVSTTCWARLKNLVTIDPLAALIQVGVVEATQICLEVSYECLGVLIVGL